jgi:2-oxo-hept-3-ene-1,7-dioate hydratase
MLSDDEVAEAAAQLDRAERTRSQIRPTSVLYPHLTLDDAYRVQDAWVQLQLARGSRIRGRKIGLTSRAMQQAMMIDEPDYGTLLDSMFFRNGAEIEAAQFTDPRIEVELAFVLRDTLSGPAVTADDVLAATDYVVPALELIAARSFRIDPETGVARGLLDTVSDNAANAGVIVGDSHLDATAIDLRWVGAILRRNGVVEETGLAAGVLDHPANGIAWLCRRFSRHGISLESGQFVLAGSFTRPIAVEAGDVIEADFGPCGTVSCRFS